MKYNKIYSSAPKTESWLERNSGKIAAASGLAMLGGTVIGLVPALRSIKDEGLLPYGVAYDQEGTRHHYDTKAKSAMDAISKAKLAAPQGANFKAFRLPDQEDQYQEYCSSVNEVKKMSRIYSLIPATRIYGLLDRFNLFKVDRKYQKGKAYLDLAGKGLDKIADFHDKWKYGTQRDQQARSYYLEREQLANQAKMYEQMMAMQRGMNSDNNLTAYKMNHDNNNAMIQTGDQTMMMQAMNPNTTVIPQESYKANLNVNITDRYNHAPNNNIGAGGNPQMAYI